VAAVLFRMPGRDPFELNAQAQPPDRQLAQAVERLRGGNRQSVVGPNPAR
jgi:hypothetical protein